MIPVPEAMSFVAGLGSELTAKLRGTVPILNLDKAREMRCEAWTCSNQQARREIGFVPQFPIDAGMRSAVAWYRQEGLL